MQSTRKCPKCHSPSLVYNEENNTLYCQNCGAVIEEEITLDSSFQQFEEERSEITYKHIEPLDELAEERDRKLMER
ncbi:MAG: TFIIB-type zinc ribbon-containing protein, partial [Candidatus Korarchaeota archaeon]|nr:TFIIB-type zinc ribbon-containing protein [Thermoproteota archaeon]